RHHPAAEPLDRRSRRRERRTQPQAIENRKAGRLQEQPGAERLRRSESFVEMYPVPGAREKQRSRHAGDSAPDDADVERSHWHASLCADETIRQGRLSCGFLAARLARIKMITLSWGHGGS